jgi:hypothetical protein
VADRGLLVIGLAAAALWFLRRPGDGGALLAPGPAPALAPSPAALSLAPTGAAPTMPAAAGVSLPSSSEQGALAEWLAGIRQALGLTALAAPAVVTGVRWITASGAELAASGGVVIPEAIPDENLALAELMYPPDESGQLAALMSGPSVSLADLEGLDWPADDFYSAPIAVPEAVPGESDAWDFGEDAAAGDAAAAGDLLKGVVPVLSAATSTVSIVQDITGTAEDWQKAALVGLDTAKLGAAATGAYGYITGEALAIEGAAAAAPYVAAAAAAVALAFDIASDMPDEQKIANTVADAGAIAAAFIPVVGILVSAVIMMTKPLVNELLWGGPSHEEREAAEVSRVIGFVGGMPLAITRTFSPTELWGGLLNPWTTVELPGPSRVVIAYMSPARGRIVRVGLPDQGYEIGDAWDLVNADPASITVTVSAGVRPEFLTQASDAIRLALQRHMLRLRTALTNDPAAIRELVMIYRRIYPDIRAGVVITSGSVETENPIFAEVLRTQYYNAVAHLYDEPDWRTFVANRLAREWISYTAALQAGDTRDFLTFVGYPSVLGLRAAVFNGSVGAAAEDPSLPDIQARIRAMVGRLPALRARTATQEAWIEAYAAAEQAAAEWQQLLALASSPGGE